MHTPRSFDHRLWPSLLHTIHTPSILFKDYVNLSQSKSPTGRAISIHEIWDQSCRLLRSRCRKSEFLLQVVLNERPYEFVCSLKRWRLQCLLLAALSRGLSTGRHQSCVTSRGCLDQKNFSVDSEWQWHKWWQRITWWWMICLALDTIHREIHRDSLTRYLKPKRCFLFSLETAKPPSWRMQAILSSGDTNANVANAPDLE